MRNFGRKLMPPAELICLQGVIDAPPWLAMEMANLIRFKTATLTAPGFQRNGSGRRDGLPEDRTSRLDVWFSGGLLQLRGKGFGVPLGN
ncbi:hypothetical protein HJA76_21710 [Rhizobium bangladeshense]|nr:hypothetical protein [Rhizobium bangladeshense]